ncbi:MAG TPA: aminopeptidase P family N-terminal domain-containing protein, partial [Chloroflexota bacterium]
MCRKVPIPWRRTVCPREEESTLTLDPERDRRNRQLLQIHHLDCLVCRLPENVLLLTGYWPLSSFAFTVVPADGPITLIAVETELPDIPEGAADEVRSYRSGLIGAPDPLESVERHLRDTLRAKKVEGGRIGIELGFEAVAAGHTAGEVLVPSAAT